MLNREQILENLLAKFTEKLGDEQNNRNQCDNEGDNAGFEYYDGKVDGIDAARYIVEEYFHNSK